MKSTHTLDEKVGHLAARWEFFSWGMNQQDLGKQLFIDRVIFEEPSKTYQDIFDRDLEYSKGDSEFEGFQKLFPSLQVSW